MRLLLPTDVCLVQIKCRQVAWIAIRKAQLLFDSVNLFAQRVCMYRMFHKKIDIDHLNYSTYSLLLEHILFYLQFHLFPNLVRQ